MKRIGRSLGNLIGLDLAYEKINDVKLLIKFQINKTNLKPLILITNRSTYDLKFHKYESRISDIIRLDDERRHSFNMSSKNSDLNRSLPLIRRRKLRMNQEFHDLEDCNIGHDLVMIEDNMGKENNNL